MAPIPMASLKGPTDTVTKDLGSFTDSVFAVIILTFVVIGLITNVISLCSINAKRSVFHSFLKVLGLSDLLVVGLCAWLYALPSLWESFKVYVFFASVPITFPLVHIVLMASVYTTIIVSLERYLRLCKLKSLSHREARKLICLVIFFPMAFYVPKFFEYRYEKFTYQLTKPVNCTRYVQEHPDIIPASEAEFELNFQIGRPAPKGRMYNPKVPQEHREPDQTPIPLPFIQKDEHNDPRLSATDKAASELPEAYSVPVLHQLGPLELDNLPPGIEENDVQEVLDDLINDLSFLGFPGLSRKFLKRTPRSEVQIVDDYDYELYLSECKNFRFGSSIYDDYMRNVEIHMEYYYPNATTMRKNRYYFKGYCIFLNVLFGSVIPLVVLSFFNFSTLWSLMKIKETVRNSQARQRDGSDRQSSSPPVTTRPSRLRQVRNARAILAGETSHLRLELAPVPLRLTEEPDQDPVSEVINAVVETNPEEMSEHSDNVSANSVNVSANSVNVSPNSVNVSPNSVNVSPNTVNVSPNSVSVSVNSDSIPENSCAVPENSLVIPEIIYDMSESSTDIPEPEIPDDVYESCSEIPEIPDDISDISYDIPDIPDDSDDIPEYPGDIPMTSLRRVGRQWTAVDQALFDEDVSRPVLLGHNSNNDDEFDEDCGAFSVGSTVPANSFPNLCLMGQRQLETSRIQNNGNQDRQGGQDDGIDTFENWQREEGEIGSEDPTLARSETDRIHEVQPAQEQQQVREIQQSGNSQELSATRLNFKNENRLTRICIAIVWLFIFCHVWKLIPTAYELFYTTNGLEEAEWPVWLEVIRHVSHTLITMNSAVNFLIYAFL